MLHGVMRVGLVSKGLLLKGDSNLELVLLCAKKPTVSLLKDVAEKLTAQLEVQHRTGHLMSTWRLEIFFHLNSYLLPNYYLFLNRRSRQEYTQLASVQEMQQWL